jgi:hypothetical protein
MKLSISAQDLELIALQQVRAPRGGILSARIERTRQTWVLIVSAREGADLDRPSTLSQDGRAEPPAPVQASVRGLCVGGIHEELS